VFRRHGVTTPKASPVASASASPVALAPGGPERPEEEGWFWPDQAFRDLIVSLIIFAVMIGLVVYGHGHKQDNWNPEEASFYDRWAHAGRDGKGANLDAPANPAADYPARPEWYFLFLFQLLKYFEGPLFLVGTLVIPGLVGLLLFVLPILGYGKPFRLGYTSSSGAVLFKLPITFNPR